MKWLFPLAVLAFFSVQCHPVGPPPGVPQWERPRPNPGGRVTPNAAGNVTSGSMFRQVNLKADMVSRGRYGRQKMLPMTPRYITIHSTQNPTADATKHAEALKKGSLRTGSGRGYIIWHFTVDDRQVVQHMPTNEQGIHADVDGPGNHGSIGIEMCEFRGCNLNWTVDRTARLTAALMSRNRIPLNHVVPHYFWPRRGMSPLHKNCPDFLLDHGRPGVKWQRFLGRVNYYYRQIKDS